GCSLSARGERKFFVQKHRERQRPNAVNHLRMFVFLHEKKTHGSPNLLGPAHRILLGALHQWSRRLYQNQFLAISELDLPSSNVAYPRTLRRVESLGCCERQKTIGQ